VCDEGGECHLQDMTLMTGHAYRRSRFRKRTYRNQYLGPFLNHEMNRCIHCYRCVRFYRDYAGGRDFSVMGSRDRVYFGRHEEGALESVFSGNLAEVCPTGVFTDKTAKRHFTRPWDLATAPSVCVHCSLGCNTIPGERYGELRRIRNRYNGEVNGYFLCDRGRYGYEFVNHPHRIRQPFARDRESGETRQMSEGEVLGYLKGVLGASNGVIGIGSPRATLESNFALRTLVGEGRFFAGVSGRDQALVSRAVSMLRGGPARTPSLAEVASADAVFVLGEDVYNTAPMLALALLQAARNQPMEVAEKLRISPWDDRAVREATCGMTGPLFIASWAATPLDRVASRVFRAAPQDVARLGFAVAHCLDATCPEVPGLAREAAALAPIIADALRAADHPLIVSGVNQGDAGIIEAAANTAWALSRTGRVGWLSLVMPECNSMGLGLICVRGIEEALDAVEKGEADTLIILENDLFRRVERGRLASVLGKCRHVVLLDHTLHETASYASVVLPAATFAEATGTLVNNEGRGQRLFQVYVPSPGIKPGWLWLRDLMAAQGVEPGAAFAPAGYWTNLDDCIAALSETIAILKPVKDLAPGADFRIEGRKVPRESFRASGRTSVSTHIDIHEHRPPDDPDSPLAFSMEGYEGEPPSSLLHQFRAPGWNSIQAVNKFQTEVGGPLHGGDPGRRLIEPSAGPCPDQCAAIPEPFTPRASFLMTPLFHAFGSEELSAKAPAVAERIPAPYVALNPVDAARLGVGEGEKVEVTLEGETLRLPVILKNELTEGTAGLPFGISGIAAAADDAYIEIRMAPHE
jgi:NADH-quinone oxidoreductase subunit G